MKNKKITLIELLLVIAVIAVLLSMLLPAINKSRRNALSAACKNNLRQAGIAVESYSSDNNGNIRLGSNWYNGETFYSQKQLFYTLQKYNYLKMGSSTTCSELPPATISFNCYGTRWYDGKKYLLGSNWIVGCRYSPNNKAFIASWAGDGLTHLIHLGKSNMLFNDGHVSSCGPIDLRSMADNLSGGFASGFGSAYFGGPGETPVQIDF